MPRPQQAQQLPYQPQFQAQARPPTRAWPPPLKAHSRRLAPRVSLLLQLCQQRGHRSPPSFCCESGRHGCGYAYGSFFSPRIRPLHRSQMRGFPLPLLHSQLQFRKLLNRPQPQSHCDRSQSFLRHCRTCGGADDGAYALAYLRHCSLNRPPRLNFHPAAVRLRRRLPHPHRPAPSMMYPQTRPEPLKRRQHGLRF